MIKHQRLNRAALHLLLEMMPEVIRERLAVHLGRPDLRFSLLQLRRFGFEPKQVLDGGAYRGDWSRLCFSVWPETSIVCVEPQKSTATALQSLAEEKTPRVKVVQALLGAVDQCAVPFRESGTGSSVYTSNNGGSNCSMWSIDSLIDQGLGPFDFVKLDVQGYELQVLSGFERYLEECQLLQLELSLLPIVEGAPRITEVLAYLDRRGFVIYDIDELIRAPSDGALWQVDALFCRENSPLRSKRTWR